MTKRGHTPADGTPAGHGPAPKATAGRHGRILATSIGVSALLALGGAAWAAGVIGVPGAGGQGFDPANTAVNAPVPAEAAGPAAAVPEAGVPAAPDPAGPGAPAPVPEGAPAADPPAAPPAPAVADPNPAPVDRNGKSDEELAKIPQPVAAPVDLKAKKTVKGGVSAIITEMTAVQGEARGIGEVAGPAVRFKLTVSNTTAAALALDGAVVDVSYGNDDQPANQLSGPDPVAFPASLAPGESGVGVFVFAVPLEARDKVKIHFNLEAETPIATFAGKAPA